MKIGSLVVSAAVFLIPVILQSYHKCGTGNCIFYCGLCDEELKESKLFSVELWVNWILPATVVGVAGVVMAIRIHQAIKNMRPEDMRA
jgi:hypothetical protein